MAITHLELMKPGWFSKPVYDKRFLKMVPKRIPGDRGGHSDYEVVLKPDAFSDDSATRDLITKSITGLYSYYAHKLSHNILYFKIVCDGGVTDIQKIKTNATTAILNTHDGVVYFHTKQTNIISYDNAAWIDSATVVPLFTDDGDLIPNTYLLGLSYNAVPASKRYDSGNWRTNYSRLARWVGHLSTFVIDPSKNPYGDDVVATPLDFTITIGELTYTHGTPDDVAHKILFDPWAAAMMVGDNDDIKKLPFFLQPTLNDQILHPTVKKSIPLNSTGVVIKGHPYPSRDYSEFVGSKIWLMDYYKQEVISNVITIDANFNQHSVEFTLKDTIMDTHRSNLEIALISDHPNFNYTTEHNVLTRTFLDMVPEDDPDLNIVNIPVSTLVKRWIPKGETLCVFKSPDTSINVSLTAGNLIMPQFKSKPSDYPSITKPYEFSALTGRNYVPATDGPTLVIASFSISKILNKIELKISTDDTVIDIKDDKNYKVYFRTEYGFKNITSKKIINNSMNFKDDPIVLEIIDWDEILFSKFYSHHMYSLVLCIESEDGSEFKEFSIGTGGLTYVKPPIFAIESPYTEDDILPVQQSYYPLWMLKTKSDISRKIYPISIFLKNKDNLFRFRLLGYLDPTWVSTDKSTQMSEIIRVDRNDILTSMSILGDITGPDFIETDPSNTPDSRPAYIESYLTEDGWIKEESFRLNVLGATRTQLSTYINTYSDLNLPEKSSVLGFGKIKLAIYPVSINGSDPTIKFLDYAVRRIYGKKPEQLPNDILELMGECKLGRIDEVYPMPNEIMVNDPRDPYHPADTKYSDKLEYGTKDVIIANENMRRITLDFSTVDDIDKYTDLLTRTFMFIGSNRGSSICYVEIKMYLRAVEQDDDDHPVDIEITDINRLASTRSFNSDIKQSDDIYISSSIISLNKEYRIFYQYYFKYQTSGFTSPYVSSHTYPSFDSTNPIPDDAFMKKTIMFITDNTITATFTPKLFNMKDPIKASMVLKKATVGGKIQLYLTDMTDTNNEHLILISEKTLTENNIFKIGDTSYSLHNNKDKKGLMTFDVKSDSLDNIDTSTPKKLVCKYIDPKVYFAAETSINNFGIYDFRNVHDPELTLMDHKRDPRPTDDPDVMYTISQTPNFSFLVRQDPMRMSSSLLYISVNENEHTGDPISYAMFKDPSHANNVTYIIPSTGKRVKNLVYKDTNNAQLRLHEGMNEVTIHIQIVAGVWSSRTYKVFCHTPNIIKAEDPTHRLPLVHDGEDANTKFTLNPIIPQITDGDSFEILAGSDKQHLVKICDFDVTQSKITAITSSSTHNIGKLPVPITITNDMIDALTDGMHDIYINYTSKANPTEDNFFKPIGVLLDCVDVSIIQHPSSFDVKDDEKNPNVIPDRIESNTFTPTFKVHFPADNHRSATGVKSWIEKYDEDADEWTIISDKKDNDDSSKDLEFLTTTPFENGEDKVRVVIDVVGGARQFEYNLRTHIPQKLEISFDKQHHINNVGEQIDFTVVDTESVAGDKIKIYLSETSESVERHLLGEHVISEEDIKTLDPDDADHEYHYSITTTITDEISKLSTGNYKAISNYIPKDVTDEEDKVLDQVLAKDLVLIHPDDIVRPTSVTLTSDEKSHVASDDVDTLYSNISSGIVLEIVFPADNLRGHSGSTVYAKIGDKVVSKKNVAIDQEAHSHFLLPLIDLENLSLNNIEIVTDIEGACSSIFKKVSIKEIQSGTIEYVSKYGNHIPMYIGAQLDFNVNITYVSPGDHIEIYLGDPASDKKFKLSADVRVSDSYSVDAKFVDYELSTIINDQQTLDKIRSLGKTTKAYLVLNSPDATHTLKINSGDEDIKIIEQSDLGNIGDIDIPTANKKTHEDSDVDGELYSTLSTSNTVDVKLPALASRPSGYIRITSNGVLISDEPDLTEAIDQTISVSIKDGELIRHNNLKVEMVICGFTITKDFILNCEIDQELEYKNGDPVDCGFIYLDPSESIISNVLIGKANDGDKLSFEIGRKYPNMGNKVFYQPLFSHIISSAESIASGDPFTADADGVVPTHRYRFEQIISDEDVSHIKPGKYSIKCTFHSDNPANIGLHTEIEDIVISNIENTSKPITSKVLNTTDGFSDNISKILNPTIMVKFPIDNLVIPGTVAYLMDNTGVVSEELELKPDGVSGQVINFKINKDLSEGYNELNIGYKFRSHTISHKLMDLFIKTDLVANVKLIDDQLVNAVIMKDGNEFKVECLTNVIHSTDKVSILIAGDEFIFEQTPIISAPDRNGLNKISFDITLDGTTLNMDHFPPNTEEEMEVFIISSSGEISFSQLIRLVDNDSSISLPTLELKHLDPTHLSTDSILYTSDRHAIVLFSIEEDQKRGTGTVLEFLSDKGKLLTTDKVSLGPDAITDQEVSLVGILSEGETNVIIRVSLADGRSNEEYVTISYTPPPVEIPTKVVVKADVRNADISETASKVLTPTLIIDIPADEIRGDAGATIQIIDKYDSPYSSKVDINEVGDIVAKEVPFDVGLLDGTYGINVDPVSVDSELIARVQYANGRYGDYPFTITYAPLDIKLPTKMKLSASCWAKDDENFDIETNNIHYSYKPDTKLLVSLDADENRLSGTIGEILLKDDNDEYKTILTNVDLADVNAIVDKEIDISSTQLKEGKNELKLHIAVTGNRILSIPFIIKYQPQVIKVSIVPDDNADPRDKSVSVALGSKVQIKMEATYMKATDHAIVSYGDDKSSSTEMIDKTLTDSDIT